MHDGRMLPSLDRQSASSGSGGASVAEEEVFGHYRLLELLGERDGRGVASLDIRKDREIALKVLHSWVRSDPRYAARFRREVSMAAGTDPGR